MRSACLVSLDTANSNKDVKGSITVKSANKILHVNQQKTVQKDIPKNVRKTKQKKDVIMEAAVPIRIVQIMLLAKIMRQKLRLS